MRSENTAEKLELAIQSLNMGDLDRADAVLGVILGDDPRSIPATRLSGVIACRRGHNQRAVDLMNQVLAAEPDDLLALVTRGEAQRALGDYPAAEASLRHALKLEPGRYDAKVNLALTLWSAGEYSQASAFFKDVLAQEPRSFLANFYLGQISFEGGDLPVAEQHFRRALELKPQHGSSKLLMGKILLARGRVAEASDEFEGAVAIEPQDFTHRLLAATTAFELGREAQALAHLRHPAARQSEAQSEAPAQWDRGILQGLGTWCEQNGSQPIRVARQQNHRNRPALFLPPMPDAIDAEESTTPEIIVAALNHCRVLPNDHLLLAGDNSVLITDIVPRPFHLSYTSPHIVHGSDDGRLLLKFPRASTGVAIPSAYLGTAESYCNWLTDCVTRLWAYHQRPAWEGLPLVVPANLSRWQREMLELLGYGESRRVTMASDCVSIFSELHVASLSSSWKDVAPFAIEHLRRTLAKSIPISASGPRRLFLSRQGMDSRRLENVGEIASLLKHHGFEMLPVESMATRDILQMIRSAEIVMGMDGAAMANAFFAPTHAKVALVTSNARQALRYSAASRAIGQEFTYLQGEADYTTNARLADCDIRLDPDVLRDYLKDT
jgi:capsular polysaccharide biosynthesis protein/tetratricopeptide (TPR) repeat protein